MASPAFPRHSVTELPPAAALAAAGATATAAAPREAIAIAPSALPPPASNLREALDAVIKIADAQATRTEAGANTVSVGFKFGEERLDIRVEMRDGEVHTQFSTDSADLRTAITGEWQSLSSSTGSRDYHFADPVFTPGGGQNGGTASDAGGGASRGQSEPEVPAQARGFFSEAGESDGAPASGTSLTPRTASPTVRHLNAFA